MTALTRLGFIGMATAAALVAAHRFTAEPALQARALPPQEASCDLQALAGSEAEFLRLSGMRAPGDVRASEELRQASIVYVARANACYTALYGGDTQAIDHDGVWFTPDGSQPFNAFGTKWGFASPFTGGVGAAGPAIAGGTVRYSFMGNGVDQSAEAADANLAITSLPGYSACFTTKITNALAAWAAVANIRFVQVADNGVAFNGAGALGDIRIGAHTFDGPLSVLAHGYYPPPNGATAAGDVHFDRQESWACTTDAGVFDIGIVAIHEFGHAIGLNHEATNVAIMRPNYNALIDAPMTDDVNGARSIYGRQVGPPADYDADRRADIVVYRPTNGVWYGLRSSTSYTTSFALPWGTTGDVPVNGDFDGDGKADAAIYRPGNGTWYMRRSSSNNTTYDSSLWGTATDVPAPQDYDGNGRADIAVFRPSNGTWYFKQTASFVQFGQAGDIPVPADYNADGRADIAVFRPSNGAWYIRNIISSVWGVSTDVPVPGDYDGDGKSEIAIFRPSNGGWYVRWSSTNYTTAGVASWGVGTDIPVPSDYNGDSRTDLAVFRPGNGTRYIMYTSGGTASVNWGSSGDVPMPR